MEQVIEVPALHELEVRTVYPFTLWEDIDGVAVRLKGPLTSLVVPVLDADRLFVVKTEKDEVPAYYITDKRGFEMPDQTPAEIPLQVRAQPALRDTIIEELGRYMSARARDEGLETIEEANDFDMEGELDDIATEAEQAFIASFKLAEGGLGPFRAKPNSGPVEPAKAVPEPVVEEEVPVPAK